MERNLGTSGLCLPYAIGRLRFNDDETVLNFIKHHIETGFTVDGDYRALGIQDNDGFLVAGAIFFNFTDTGNAEFAGAASRGRMWATKNVMRGIFAHAFGALELHRLTALVDATNTRAIKWNERAGFVEEGRLREAGKDRCDTIVYGMLKTDCRWINGKEGWRQQAKGA